MILQFLLLTFLLFSNILPKNNTTTSLSCSPWCSVSSCLQICYIFWGYIYCLTIIFRFQAEASVQNSQNTRGFCFILNRFHGYPVFTSFYVKQILCYSVVFLASEDLPRIEKWRFYFSQFLYAHSFIRSDSYWGFVYLLSPWRCGFCLLFRPIGIADGWLCLCTSLHFSFCS